jgi:serine/threonine protein kinase/Tol biopolymer transport system component
VEEPALPTLEPTAEPPVELNWLAPPQQPEELGRLGPYRILGILGSGGMGIVFRAEDAYLARPVALKVMRPSSGEDDIARHRFLREARAGAALQHDHVITIYQVGEDRGVPYLAMELLQGESLNNRLRRHGRLPIAEVLRIGREMALALAAAHAQDMIHRDIKPDNVWLAGDAGRVKILDFGLARVGGDIHLTKAGMIVGTPAYLCPEQAAGKDVDARCDLFCLGSVLYQLVTGELPFKGEDTLTVLIAITNDAPVPPWEINRAVPQELSELIMRLLAKDRRYRPASAKEVIDTLEGIEQELAGSGPALDVEPMLESEEWRPSAKTKELVPKGASHHGKSWLTPASFVAVFLLTLIAGWRLLAPFAANSSRTSQTTTRAVDRRPALTSLDDLRPQDVPAALLSEASDGNLEKAPSGLVAVWRVAMPGTAVTALAFSQDGKLLACGTRQGRVRLLSMPTGERVRLLTAHARMIKRMAFISRDKVLVTSANDGQVRIWSVDSGERSAGFRMAGNDAGPLAFSFDGKMVATSSSAEKGDRLQLHRIMPEGPPIPVLHDSRLRASALALGSAGLLAAGDADRKTVRYWDVNTGAVLYAASPSPGKPPSSLAFSPDGRFLAGTFLSTNIVRVWYAATGRPAHLLEGRPKTYARQTRQNVAIGPDNSTLAAVTSAGVIRLWDLSTGKPGKLIRLWPAVPHVDQIAFSPDGRHLATANSTGTAYILRIGDSSKQ